MAWVFNWISPIGTSFLLSAPPFFKVRFRSLMGSSAPPFAPATDNTPLNPGSYLKYINTDNNEVDLTLLIQGPTEVALWNLLTIMPSLFNPLYVDASGNPLQGTLQVTIPNEITRSLSCVCISGFKIDEESLQETSVEATLTFFANNPFWYGDLKSFGGTLDGNPALWFPIFPLILGPAFTGAVFTLNYEGDAPSYPLWTITGPGTNFTLTNQTTNQRFEIAGVTLTAGQTITVDMQNKTVTLYNGANLLPFVTFDSSFWPFVAGENIIRFDVTGSDANTAIQASYREYFLGVL